MDLKIRNIYAVPRAELHTGKFGVNPSISFEVTGHNVILSGWSIWNGNGNGSAWLVLHFQVLVDSIDPTWRHVAKSSHLAANVMTDRQTDTQTHTQTDKPSDVGEKHNTFFQRYNHEVQKSRGHYSKEKTGQAETMWCRPKRACIYASVIMYTNWRC